MSGALYFDFFFCCNTRFKIHILRTEDFSRCDLLLFASAAEEVVSPWGRRGCLSLKVSHGISVWNGGTDELGKALMSFPVSLFTNHLTLLQFLSDAKKCKCLGLIISCPPTSLPSPFNSSSLSPALFWMVGVSLPSETLPHRDTLISPYYHKLQSSAKSNNGWWLIKSQGKTISSHHEGWVLIWWVIHWHENSVPLLVIVLILAWPTWSFGGWVGGGTCSVPLYR